MLASEKFASTGDGTKLTLPFPIYINDLTRSMQADGWFFRVITVQWNLLLRHNFEFLFPERPLVRRADSMRNIVVRRKGASHFLFPCCDCIIARYASVVNTLFTINIVFFNIFIQFWVYRLNCKAEPQLCCRGFVVFSYPRYAFRSLNVFSTPSRWLRS